VGSQSSLRVETCHIVMTPQKQKLLPLIEEGVRLALHWTPLKVNVEFDCTKAVEMIRESFPNTSAYAFRISAICDLLRVGKEMLVLLKLAMN
jgi:hypothetical protein